MSTNINLIESLTANREKQERIDESLAKQLQRSMELNARMKNRLTKFMDHYTFLLTATSKEDLHKILTDTD